MLLLGTLFTVLVVGVLIISLDQASPALRSRSSVLALLVVQPFSLLSIWLAGARLARLAGPPSTVTDAFLANALSVVAFMVIPGRISEAVKPLVLRLRNGLPVARGFAAVALERLFDLACLALLAALAAAGAAAHYAGELRHAAIVLAVILAAGSVVLGVVAVWPALGRRMVDILPFQWVRDAGNEMLGALLRLRTPATLVLALVYSALAWGASFLIFYVLIGLVGAIELSPAQVLIVLVAGTLGFVVTVTPGGLGTYEGAIMLALASFGYTFADGLAIALLLRIANVLPAIPASIWLLARSGITLSDLSARTKAERGE